ncbi:MAG: hypothetical protein J0M08_12145 [Bacteroidetes bacterium]|nr:hypothetical protein [Bacteroidota bacterium]
MKSIIKYKYTLVGLFIGAVAGYLYYYFVGCSSGSCSITSSPINSTVYGAIMGVLAISSFKKETNKN